MAKLSDKYTEIFKLKTMLEDAGIMFDWIPNFRYSDDELMTKYPDLMEHYQICYPVFDSNYRVVSVIEGYGTFGAEEDTLEIMFKTKEDNDDRVIGHLIAEEVFAIIKKHWDSVCHN